MDLQLIFGITGNILSLYFGIKLLQTYKNNRLLIVNQLNDYLFFIMFYNTFYWLYYSILLKDIYIFINNIFPLFGNFGMMLICYTKLDESRKLHIEMMSGILISYFIIMTFLFNFSSIPYDKLVFIFGIGSVFTSIGSYLAPILIIREVIETRNHKLIYIPQVIIGLITMIIYMAYGFVINNLFIILIDAIIILICIIQLFFYCYYKYVLKSNEKKINKNEINIELPDIKPYQDPVQKSSELIVTDDKESEIFV